jgi:hypothetical protein
MLAVEFARFLGLPLSIRSYQADVTNAVCGALSDLRAELGDRGRDPQPELGHEAGRQGLRPAQIPL